MTFEGSCDASGAIELDAHRVLVADDENDVLRIYDVDRGGRATLELMPNWNLGGEGDTESDLEASTLLGDLAFFLSSHGLTSKGIRDPERLLLFAARVPPEAGRLQLVGQPYRSLLDDLVSDPRLARFGLAEAAQRAPKEPGGLNLEGLTVSAEGGLLVGFRSPVPEGRALIVGISNPHAVLEGKRAVLTEAKLLDLGGLGIRALSRWRGRLLVLAGPTGEGGPFRLFQEMEGALRPIDVDLTGLGAEALYAHDTRDEVLVLSDDGARVIEGKRCKKLKDPHLKRFRGLWVKVPQ